MCQEKIEYVVPDIRAVEILSSSIVCSSINDMTVSEIEQDDDTF